MGFGGVYLRFLFDSVGGVALSCRVIGGYLCGFSVVVSVRVSCGKVGSCLCVTYL